MIPKGRIRKRERERVKENTVLPKPESSKALPASYSQRQPREKHKNTTGTRTHMKHKSSTRPQQNETGPKEESMKECKAKLAGERAKVHPQKHVNQNRKRQNPKKPNEEQTMEDLSEHKWAIEGPLKTHRTKGELMKKQSAKQREHWVAKSTETFDDNPLEFKGEGSPANR